MSEMPREIYALLVNDRGIVAISNAPAATKYIRADLAEKPATDDAQLEQDIKDAKDMIGGFTGKNVGIIQRLIRAAQNSVKQKPDDDTQPVLQPVGELQEAIERAKTDIQYCKDELKGDMSYQVGYSEMTFADIEIIVNIAEKYSRLPADWEKDSSLETWFPITAETIKKLEIMNRQLRAAQSQNKNGEKE